MFAKLLLLTLVFVSLIASVEAKKKKYKTYTVPIEILREGEGELIPKGANVTFVLSVHMEGGELIWEGSGS